jgi:two-component sensor histidine kinase
VASLSPQQLYPNVVSPIYLQSVSLDDLPISSPTLVVPPGHHRIDFNFTSPDFNAPDRIRFRYKLDGWDRDWVDAGNKRQISYTGIPAGRYRFQVIVANEYGSWNPRGASIPVTVHPSFYQTTWFLSCCIALVAVLFWAILRFRTAQVTAQVHYRLQGRVEERTRIARDLHDTLLQGILGVSMQIYMAAKQLPPDSPAKPILDRVVGRVQGIIEEGRNTLKDLRSPSLQNNNLEQSLSSLLREAENPQEIRLALQSEGELSSLNSRVQDETFHIAKEALTNALRHADATLVNIRIKYGPRNFTLAVTDNGRGISGPIVRIDHWGITGMTERAKHIGGKLRLRTHSNAGTSVELRVPARIAYSEDTGQDIYSSFLHRMWNRISLSPKNSADQGGRAGSV